MTLPFYTTTITIVRTNAGPSDEGEMVDPWDDLEITAAGTTTIASGLPAFLGRRSRRSAARDAFASGSAREEDQRILRVDPGGDLRPGDVVLDEQTGYRWRIEAVVEASAGLPVDTLRANVVRVSGG
jgi:hypothetical protein